MPNLICKSGLNSKRQSKTGPLHRALDFTADISDWGSFLIQTKDRHIIGLHYSPRARASQAGAITPLNQQARKELHHYFNNRIHYFSLPFKLEGTPFQRQVWHALRRIPYGQTCSYADIARQIHRPKAYRAVAQACKKNPLMLLVPCHRVIASDGKIGGFNAGIDLKRRLLALEKSQWSSS
jgi:methylated-DNA-[protein]-cysteine S-methyltransferase